MLKLLQRHGVVLTVAVIVLLLPLVLPSNFYFRIATLTFIFALAVLGLNLVMGPERPIAPTTCPSALRTGAAVIVPSAAIPEMI